MTNKYDVQQQRTATELQAYDQAQRQLGLNIF